MGLSVTAEELAYFDIHAPLFGFLGAAFALVFSNLGAAYGTGKSGMGISALGVTKPELVMKSIVPVRKTRPLGAGRVQRCAPPRPTPPLTHVPAVGKWE